MNSKSRKRFVKAHKPYKCELCGNEGNWLGKPLSLQVDHIDGNSSNESIDNLRFLCPNCHSQTETFTGRNAKHKNFNKPSREEFLELIKIYTVKEISMMKAVSLRAVYQWFKFYLKENKPTTINRRLSCGDVSCIRELKDPATKLALIFGVSDSTIGDIRRYQTYKDCN
jgi:hypothetical protein